MRILNLVLFYLVTATLSAHALGGYFSAKIKNKEYHFYIGPTSSYFYQKGEVQTYFLKKEIVLGTVRTFEIFEKTQAGSEVGKIQISDDAIDVFELNQIKTKNIKFKKLNYQIEPITLTKQIYNNDKCSFKFVDLNDIENIYLFKEVTFLISEIMDVFKDYDCDYLKSSRSNEMKVDLNQLTCENEIFLMKNRFYGINFMCKAGMAKGKNFKYQVFSTIYDKTLKARVEKSDFTASDISSEDDSRNLDFRLTPVGLGLYSADLHENKEEYLRIIPYFNLKKNFSVWGKPKRYLSNFSLK